MGGIITAAATARYYIAKVIEQNGGLRAVAALEPRQLRSLIKNSFCLAEACKCDKEQCSCLPCQKKIGLKYRKALWSRQFRAMLRKAPNAYLNRVLAQTPF